MNVIHLDLKSNIKLQKYISKIKKTKNNKVGCFMIQNSRREKYFVHILFIMAWMVSGCIASVLTPNGSPQKGDFFLADGKTVAALVCDSLQNETVMTAFRSLARDIDCVTGIKPSTF
jgi:hypothetical protein